IGVVGSVANNIFVGGYDNDVLSGRDGDDILMGGKLRYARNNPNAAGIPNDGPDELYGGAGDDSIVFEADGGVIDGDNRSLLNIEDNGGDGAGHDTLYLTQYSTGTKTLADLTTDSTL